jgi:transcriptional regulator NrdR family protein
MREDEVVLFDIERVGFARRVRRACVACEWWNTIETIHAVTLTIVKQVFVKHEDLIGR